MQAGAKMNEKEYTAMIEGGIEIFRRTINGDLELITRRRNVVVYTAADILAKLLGGDATYVPSRIGFIYAASGESFPNPGTERDQDWASIAQTISDKGGNMILCTMASPVFSAAGDYYNHNVVTLSTMSDRDADRAFSGAPYGGAPAAGDKYFQVVLLARTFVAGSSTPVYTPYAIAQLTDTNDGLAIEDNTEIVVYWSMAFK